MDVKFKSNNINFKFRVCGILKNKDKYLVVKINDNPFYCLPGGHVELGEDTDAAVLREMQEELNFPVKINRLIAINQNFYPAKNERFHELGFYYVVSAVKRKDIIKNDYVREENDKGTIQHLEFKWVTEQEMKNINFFPKFIAENLNRRKPIIITSRND